MRLEPTNPCGSTDDFEGSYLTTLTNGCIESGTTLFNVFAYDEPPIFDGRENWIGEIVTTSDVVTSTYGDTRIFFRHKRFEEDISVHGHWEAGV
jgi:hypothetical protein